MCARSQNFGVSDKSIELLDSIQAQTKVVLIRIGKSGLLIKI